MWSRQQGNFLSVVNTVMFFSAHAWRLSTRKEITSFGSQHVVERSGSFYKKKQTEWSQQEHNTSGSQHMQTRCTWSQQKYFSRKSTLGFFFLVNMPAPNTNTSGLNKRGKHLPERLQTADSLPNKLWSQQKKDILSWGQHVHFTCPNTRRKKKGKWIGTNSKMKVERTVDEISTHTTLYLLWLAPWARSLHGSQGPDRQQNAQVVRFVWAHSSTAAPIGVRFCPFFFSLPHIKCPPQQ